MNEANARRWIGIVLALATLTVGFRIAGTTEYFSRGMLGYEVDAEVVSSLRAGYPAERSGLRVGDRILEVAGSDRRLRAGDKRTVIVERGDERLRFEVTAAPLPAKVLGFLVASGFMGLAFLGIGVAVFLRTRSGPGALLALYGIGQALHWGGNPHVASAALNEAMKILILLATMLAAAFLLHLTLVLPPSWPVASRRPTPAWLYGPAVAALVLATLGLATPFRLLMNVQAYAYTLAALVVLVVRYRRADAETRRAHQLGIVIGGFVAAVVPYLAALLVTVAAPDFELPGGMGPFPYTLFFVLIPVAFAIGILASIRDRRTAASSV